MLEKGQKPKKKTWPALTSRGQDQKFENKVRGQAGQFAGNQCQYFSRGLLCFLGGQCETPPS